MSSDYESKIIAILAEDSSISVNELSKQLNVSAVTVRTCLSSLEEKGLIIRSKGGALPAFHPSIMERLKNMNDSKKRIAKAAAEMVQNGDTIMVDAGTTTALIAKYLLGKRDIHIVSNSSLIFPYARINPAMHLTLIGGEFRPATESFVGPMTLRELEQFHVSLAFIGTDGFSIEHGLTTHLIESAEVAKKIAEKADKVVLIADAQKFGKKGFVQVLPINAVDTLITDTTMTDEAVAAVEKTGVTVSRV
ncbi:MAG: DeoR/GlpR transcriptional regulator [Spirochaetes bacterium]|nr:DeoR/GlpR transcriptional regulator [Spirochaetota bacterium]